MPAPGRVQLWAWDLTGEGRAGRRAAMPTLDRGDRARGSRQPRPAAPRRGSRRPAGQLVRPRHVSGDRRAGCWSTSRPATSSRSTCRSGSRPAGRSTRSTSTSGSSDRSPAPFAAFLHWDDLAVVSASPEWFYQTRGDRIVTRPIKGTRPRGAIRGRRRPARRRAARLAQGPRRADHDRRPRAQRPGPRLPVWLGRRPRRARASNRSPRCTTWSPRSRGGCGPTSARSTSSAPSSPAARSPARRRSAPWRSSTSSSRTAAASTPARSAT